MGRPFRLVSERRQIARPSYGGEREPDSHPTPGPPTFVQSARVQRLLAGSAPRSSPGVVRSLGRFLLVQFAGLPVETDVSTGVWLSSARRRGEPGTVGALVPAVFEAYARILHPAVRYAGDDDVEVPWSEVAAHNGTAAHPLVQWVTLTRGPVDSQPPVWDDGPSEGHLPVAVARRLVEVLRPPHRGRRTTASSGAGTASATTSPRPRCRPGSCCAAGRDVVLVRGADRRRGPQPRARAARAERQPVVAGRPGLVRGHRHRPDEHLRRRQPRPASAEVIGAPGLEASPPPGRPGHRGAD